MRWLADWGLVVILPAGLVVAGLLVAGWRPW